MLSAFEPQAFREIDYEGKHGRFLEFFGNSKLERN